MSIKSNRQLWKVQRWIKRQLPTVVAGVVMLLLWEGIAQYIDNNRIFASISYTGRQLMAEIDTVAIKLTETFTSVTCPSTSGAMWAMRSTSYLTRAGASTEASRRPLSTVSTRISVRSFAFGLN